MQPNAPPATAAGNANIRAGLQQGDLGSPLRPDERRASARSYAPDGSRVTVVPSYEGECSFVGLPVLVCPQFGRCNSIGLRLM